jgi:hypothetical protein
LVKLLVGMTRNKVAFQARKQRALGRDHRRVEALDPANCDVAAARLPLLPQVHVRGSLLDGPEDASLPAGRAR